MCCVVCYVLCCAYPYSHYQTLEETLNAQLSVPYVSFCLLGFSVCFHYMYTTQLLCILFRVLLNMQVIFLSIHSLSGSWLLLEGVIFSAKTCIREYVVRAWLSTSFCRQTTVLLETAGDTASSTHLIFLDQFVAWWFFPAFQAPSLPLGHPAPR